MPAFVDDIKALVSMNVSSFLERATDPVKESRYAVQSLNQAVRVMKGGVADLTARAALLDGQKRVALKSVKEWEAKASRAQAMGFDDAALTCLAHRRRRLAEAQSADEQLEQLRSQVLRATMQLDAMDQRLSEFKLAREQLVSRLETARAVNKAARALSGKATDGENVFERLTRATVREEVTAALDGPGGRLGLSMDILEFEVAAKRQDLEADLQLLAAGKALPGLEAPE